MNDQTKTLLTVTLLGLSLLLALSFQIRLTGPAGLHFTLLALASLLFALILVGIWIEEPWALQLSTLFFALALADLVWMYIRLGDALVGSVALLINVAGMAVTTVGMNNGHTYSLETYDIEEDIRDLKKELENIRRANKKKK